MKKKKKLVSLYLLCNCCKKLGLHLLRFPGHSQEVYHVPLQVFMRLTHIKRCPNAQLMPCKWLQDCKNRSLQCFQIALLELCRD